MRSTAQYDVVVVGAGIAGLTAAVELARMGMGVKVFEARPEAGGRAKSMRSSTGGAVDMGATWCWSHEPLVQTLAEQLGIATFPQWIDGDALFESERNGTQRLVGNPVDVPALRFEGGAQELAHRLARQLPPGALGLSRPVRDVRLTDGGQALVGASCETVTARHVVLALSPALAVSEINFEPALPADVHTLAELTAVWMGGVIKAVAVYRHAFWRKERLAGAVISHRGPFGEIHDHSGSDGSLPALFGFAPAARFVNSSTEEVGGAFVSQLVRLFGREAAAPSSVQIRDWSKEGYTTPSMPSPHASVLTYGAEVFQTAIAGRIHWASTETAVAHAGHIEGAIMAGAHVAAKLKNDQ